MGWREGGHPGRVFWGAGRSLDPVVIPDPNPHPQGPDSDNCKAI